ncbi:MAG: DUF3368 domain-containing protein [Euryarchaeota archaeon]|nr:DUF3368 domain-containing protein [Euryarchaeota archaeon]
MIVVSNSGPLIALAKLGLLFILKEFFGEVFVPPEVWNEVVERGKGKPGEEEVRKAKWIKVREIEDRLSVEVLCRDIGRGEAEAIILAKKTNALLIMDEKIPREIATSLGLEVTGTLGLVYRATERKAVKQSFENIVMEMRKRKIWISDEIVEDSRKAS